MSFDKKFLEQRGFKLQPDGTYSKTCAITHQKVVWNEEKGNGERVMKQPLSINPENALKTAASMLQAMGPSHTVKSMKEFIVNHCPMGAPRMTRRDKWKKRDCVERYHALRDAIRAVVGVVNDIPDRVDCIFFFPMPESWSEKKKFAMLGTAHRVRPDRDNCEKSILDALFLEDGGIHEGFTKKVWTFSGKERIVIRFYYY